MNAGSLGRGVLARTQRLLHCSVGQGAPDRCHFHSQLIRYRQAQPLLSRRHTTRAQAVVAAVAAQPVERGSEMDPAVEVTVEKIHCTTARIVLFLGGGASQVGPAGVAGRRLLFLHQLQLDWPGVKPRCETQWFHQLCTVTISKQCHAACAQLSNCFPGRLPPAAPRHRLLILSPAACRRWPGCCRCPALRGRCWTFKCPTAGPAWQSCWEPHQRATPLQASPLLTATTAATA